MSTLRDTIIRWIDKRTTDMLAAPRIWGSDEAIEMQVLLLLQFRALTLRPDFDHGDPGALVDAYMEYLTRTYPQCPHQPLHQIVEADRLGFNIANELRKVVQTFTRSMLEENPFQHNDLAIRLVFEKGRTPTTAAFTGYYEEFRRAARAVARRVDKAVGRAPKGIEEATDFALSDVRVTPKNGAPAEALLLLGAGVPSESRDWVAENAVRSAIVDLVTMGEWATSDADVSALPVDDMEQRSRTTVQAMRIIPRRGIMKAEIGGTLIGRAKPVEFRPEHERRFLTVLGSSAPSEMYDETEEIRGIDLDRGLVIVNRKMRLPCYVRPEQLQEVTEVGIQAHVMGTLYKPLTGRPFVIVSHIVPVNAGSSV
ncbi:hypothetical protein [Polyangium spumosum]|uniref:Uncharacterized protein n=1 Tax=Polyangium spumosum TaxID=889282 RepID=A0A6N7Q6I6_9BACT|nr:hypothetical protein [Polyangium spumosum]MRG96491.1 hypothetical protein [Polyangium spumosum]